MKKNDLDLRKASTTLRELMDHFNRLGAGLFTDEEKKLEESLKSMPDGEYVIESGVLKKKGGEK